MSALQEKERLSLHRGPERDVRRDLGEDVRAGLTSTPKWLSCRHLYDARGSELFDEICRQPEYYPTRSEAAILRILTHHHHAPIWGEDAMHGVRVFSTAVCGAPPAGGLGGDV